MRTRFLKSLVAVLNDATTFAWLLVRSGDSVTAENLFLRNQLALYHERGIKPRQTDPATRLTMARRS